MMQIKKSQVILTVGASKKVVDLIISISIPFAGMADCCLKRLKFNCSEGTDLMQGSEESALAFALFETIRAKLSGSALEVFKMKVTGIECNTLDGFFVLKFKTQSTGTSLRKTCGITLGQLNTNKLFSKYSENMKFLSGKGGKREEFNYVSKKFLEGVKKSIVITAIGKFPASFDESKLKEIITTLVDKIPEFEMPTAKEILTPTKREPDAPEVYPVIKCSGLTVAIVADYVRNNSNMSIAVVDEGVVVYNHMWPTKQKQLQDPQRIQDYVEKKYTKLEENHELSSLFAYYALSEGFINSEVAEKILITKLKTAKLIDLLKKTL